MIRFIASIFKLSLFPSSIAFKSECLLKTYIIIIYIGINNIGSKANYVDFFVSEKKPPVASLAISISGDVNSLTNDII